MTSTAQTTKNAITLKGSAAIISEYLSESNETNLSISLLIRINRIFFF